VKLSREKLEILKRIDKYQLPFLEMNMLSREKWTRRDLSNAILEFKKFVALAGFGIQPLAMIGPKVDDVWHNFLLFTKQYNSFCEQTIGKYINHQPHTEVTPVPHIAFQRFTEGYVT
jgi:hypothetical protein